MKKVFSLCLTFASLFAGDFASNMPVHGPGHNVHVLDAYVEAHLPALLERARTLDFGNPNLSKQEAQEVLCSQATGALIIDGKPIARDVIIGQLIPACLTTAYETPLTQELYSRLVSVSTDFRFLLESICENYATGGGCLQGVRNRGAIVFALAFEAMFSPTSGL